MKMRKKVRKFQDGGETEFESKQGKNSGIDDDVRARAMNLAEDDSPAGKSGFGEENELPDVITTRVTKPSVSKPPVKPTATRPSKAESKAVSNKPTSPVSSAREKTGFEKKKEAFMNRSDAEPSPAKTTETRKSPSFLNFKESIKKTFSFPRSQRTVAAEKSMKAGGKVSSASKRADGIAIRGKTRA